MKALSFLSILFLFFLVSCGESPLLNHRMEKSFGRSATFSQEAEGYRFKKTDALFTIDWTQGPGMGESKFTVKTWTTALGTSQGPYQDFSKEFFVYLWMPSMGHGSSPVKITRRDQGEYEVSNVYFIMGGKWEIHFQLKDKGQVVDEVIVPVTL